MLAISIVVCNLATPAIRKSSILEEMSSLTYGLLVIVFLFCLTWSMAPLAYIRFTDIQLPDFYPAFQVLNSFMGTLVFLLMGISNVRFRAVVTGNVENRVITVQCVPENYLTLLGHPVKKLEHRLSLEADSLIFLNCQFLNDTLYIQSVQSMSYYFPQT